MARMPVAVGSAVAGALLWGTMGPVAALLTDRDRLAVAGFRMALGALTLLLVGRVRWRRWARRDVLPLVIGAVGMAGFQLSYFAAVGVSGVAVATAVSIGLAPVCTGLSSAVVERRWPSAAWLVGTAAAIVGLMLLALGDGSGVRVSVVGLLLSVVAAACFSAQVYSIQALAGRHGDAGALAAMFAGAAILLVPSTILTVSGGLFVGRDLVCLLYLGIVISGGAYWLFSHGVRWLGAAAAVTISLLEPAGAAVIAALLLGQRLALAQWLGIVVICGAVLVVGLGGRRRLVESVVVDAEVALVESS